MADDTDTTRPGETEAVEAALSRATWTATLSAVEVGEVVKVAMSLPAADIAAEVIAAAYPVIAAAVREQAAQDIETMDPTDFENDVGWALTHAADVARDAR